MFDLFQHQLTGNAMTSILGKDRERVNIILSYLRLVLGIFQIHIRLVRFIIIGWGLLEKCKGADTSLMIALAIVTETKTDRTVIDQG